MRIFLYIALAYVLTINLLAFVFYGVDKYKAKHNSWRIPESKLLWLSFLGGSLGSLLGMSVFHHKTQHLKFKLLVPFSLVMHIALLVSAYWYLFVSVR